MHSVEPAIVLARRNIREYDRIISVYTRGRGRLTLRVPGVNRPSGKLKAISEPFSWSEFRIASSSAAGFGGTVSGGKIISVFPSIRADLMRTRLALHFCELILRMTPESQPSREKYNLLVSALSELERRPAPHALRAAFTLRLMREAGLGLDRPVLGINTDFWAQLHDSPLSDLEDSDLDPRDLEKASRVVARFCETHLERPLRSMMAFASERGTVRPH